MYSTLEHLNYRQILTYMKGIIDNSVIILGDFQQWIAHLLRKAVKTC